MSQQSPSGRGAHLGGCRIAGGARLGCRGRDDVLDMGTLLLMGCNLLVSLDCGAHLGG